MLSNIHHTMNYVASKFITTAQTSDRRIFFNIFSPEFMIFFLPIMNTPFFLLDDVLQFHALFERHPASGRVTVLAGSN